MVVIKEVTKEGNYVLRTDHYGNSLSVFEYLFAKAKDDFPDLQSPSVNVVKYGGWRYKNTYGIEFHIDGELNSAYNIIERLELVS